MLLSGDTGSLCTRQLCVHSDLPLFAIKLSCPSVGSLQVRDPFGPEIISSSLMGGGHWLLYTRSSLQAWSSTWVHFEAHDGNQCRECEHELNTIIEEMISMSIIESLSMVWGTEITSIWLFLDSYPNRATELLACKISKFLQICILHKSHRHESCNLQDCKDLRYATACQTIEDEWLVMSCDPFVQILLSAQD